MNLRNTRTNSNDPTFRMLEAELEAELSQRDDSIQQRCDRYDTPQSYIDTVIVAYDGDTPVGFGCFKPFDDSTAEIKRMYVRKDYRRKGVASIILMELELWAGQHDFIKLILQTSTKQPEAMQLYAKFGYKQIASYGMYANIASSVGMQKLILE
ncbi:GNAT family N-acetyltransferase [uncultured Acetobacteroides sp.]|uniref:GNAT family N-acetyltransferase n=1 Tax=uncultured Acetobacteroides sp. TaxID=1760811 RepID=UPI0029F493C4|nr:GNAT family N-acetyltransferase [uncultured Acetobacteroides sp.]